MDGSRELTTYFNGEVMPHSQALELMKEKKLESSSGFYDNERTFNGQLFKLRQHLDRLYNGLNFSNIDPKMSVQELEDITAQVLDANRHMLGPGEEFTVTQVVSLSPITLPSETPEVNVMVYCQYLDFLPFAGSYVNGVRLVTPVTYGVPQSEVENGKPGGQQVIPLMTGREGSITECSGANFMFVVDGRIKLPDRHDVLPGVSMQTVLELAEQVGVPIDEDDYTPADVYVADEAFISSTKYCILPVATLNGYTISDEVPGPLTRKLLDAWQVLVKADFIQQALDHLDNINGASSA